MNEKFASYLKGIPVIDIFAGPGGLGEGFAAFRTDSQKFGFDIKLSIEKDQYAHRTLELRSFFRFLKLHGDAEDYYSYVKGWIDRETLFSRNGKAAEYAKHHAWHFTLELDSRTDIQNRIDEALRSAASPKPWVLIGGPPCQAYSTAGRSRMRPVLGDVFYEDERHYLYREYLQIIKDHEPDVFVMENVKGILSSKINGNPVFDLICDDLRNAAGTGSYQLFSFVSPQSGKALFTSERILNPHEFIIFSEQYGIPQARHRVIILGVRVKGLTKTKFRLNSLDPAQKPVSTGSVLSGLPSLRSGLSKTEDSDGNWKKTVKSIGASDWLKRMNGDKFSTVKELVISCSNQIEVPECKRGGQFVPWKNLSPEYRPEWYDDPLIEGALNHETRLHMESDLHRYMFAACYANINGLSPKLRDFPKELLPNHVNVKSALKGGMFNDRFRVQVKDLPASTITSHIQKDGHYFIHPDPGQCRSLTVREVARLQTFPDNYFFEGSRTQQYKQVGNAVPPLLATQIAKVVRQLLNELYE